MSRYTAYTTQPAFLERTGNDSSSGNDVRIQNYVDSSLKFTSKELWLPKAASENHQTPRYITGHIAHLPPRWRVLVPVKSSGDPLRTVRRSAIRL